MNHSRTAVVGVVKECLILTAMIPKHHIALPDGLKRKRLPRLLIRLIRGIESLKKFHFQ